MHNTRTYATISIDDLNLIDFNQVIESNINVIRKSIDGTQFVIKWRKGYTPTFINDGTIIPIGTYDHHAILELMVTPEWTPEEQE